MAADLIKTDISSLDDVKILVDSFYEKVRQDDLLKNIFEGRIENHWQQHLEKMYRFWQTVLLEEHTYQGSPFLPHAQMPIDEQHFNRWLSLWESTVNNHFSGKIADEAKWRGGRMAEMFRSKIEYYREMNSKPLI